MSFEYVVYKITFPNGKIYIGKDIGGSGHSLRYFGSWNNELVKQDFSKEQIIDFTLRKEILFESNDKKEVGKKEGYFILFFKSNDPAIGYNQTHRPRNLEKL
ncbi:MAG: GIY-YIG nuclease family protein [Rickettsiales bacterium]|jgi:hypothetical protein